MPRRPTAFRALAGTVPALALVAVLLLTPTGRLAHSAGWADPPLAPPGTGPAVASSVRLGSAVPSTSLSAVTTATSERSLILSNDSLVQGHPTEPNCPDPTGAAIGGGTVFVLCGGGYEEVAEINATRLAFEGVVPIPLSLGNQIGGIAYDPVTNCFYIGSEAIVGISIDSNLTGYNLTTGSWGTPWADGALTGPLAYDPSDQRLYEASIDLSSVAIDGFDPSTGTEVSQIDLLQSGAAPVGLAIVPGSNWMYVALGSTDALDVVNLTSGLFGSAVPTTAAASSVAFDPANGDLYAALGSGDNVSVLGAANHTAFATVAAGTDPDGLAWDPASQEILVANGGSANVTRISSTTQTVAGSSATGSYPGPILYDPSAGAMVTVNVEDANLTSINATTGSSSPATGLGAYPYAVAYDPVISAVLVGDDWTNAVTAYAVGSWTPIARVALQGSPFGIAIDPANDRVFVADEIPNALSVLNASTLAIERTVRLLHPPTALVFDPSTGDVAVTSFDDNNVTIVNVSAGFVTGNISVPLPTSISVDPALRELYVTSWGGYSTGGSPAVVAINDETDRWDRFADLYSSSGDYSSGFDPVDGHLYVGEGDATEYFDPSTLVELGSLPSSSGGALAIDPASGAIFVAGPLETLAFASSTGLPLAGFNLTTYAGSIASDPTTSGVFVPDLVNGTLGIGTLGPSIGSFVADPASIAPGSSTQLTTTLAALSGTAVTAYPTLPPGCTSANTLDLTCVPDTTGTFPVEVTVADASGLTTDAWTNVSVSGGTTPTTYAVTFTESGLGPSAPWTVTVDGTPLDGMGPGLSLQEPNGSYTFTVSSSGYTASPSSGTVPVAGAPVEVSVAFAAIMAGTTGYLAGSVTPITSHLEVGAITIPLLASAGSFNVSLKVGTYTVAATSSGYNDSSRSVTIDVGVTTEVRIVLVQNATTGNKPGNHTGPSLNGTSPSAFPTELVGLGLLAVAVFAVAAGVWFLQRRRRDPAGPPRQDGVEPAGMDPAGAGPPAE